MKRFIIANIGSNTEIYYMAPYQTVIWSKVITVSQTDQDASFWTTAFGAGWDDVSVEPTYEITNVYHGITLFSNVASYAELSAVPNSFYWDFDTQTLFVRIYRDTPEYGIPTNYAYGLAVGVIDSSDLDNEGLISSTIGGVSYHPALFSSGLAAMVAQDNYKYNKMTMDDFTITINNASGLFDAAKSAFYKQRVDVYLADVPEDVPIESETPGAVTANDYLTLIRTGIVDDINYGGDSSFSMTVIDPRRTWDRVAPYDVLTAADFEDPLDPRSAVLMGKVKPLAIGPITRCPTVNLSKQDTLNGSQHLISSTVYGPITSVTQCFEIVDDIETDRSFSVDLATGILTITTGQYQGGLIIVDGVGLSLDRSIYVDSGPESGYTNTPQQIAYWAATRLGAVPDTSGYFDRQSFRDAELSGSDSYLYIPVGGGKLLDVIDAITLPANWTMYVEAGTFRARRISGDASRADRLYPDELAAHPDINWEATNFATRIQYNYDEDLFYDISHSIFDDSREAALIPRYRVSVLAEVDSHIFHEASAIEHKDERYERIAFIPAVLECDLLETPRWNLFDFVIFDYLMDGRQRLPELIYRVIGIDKIGRKVTLRQYTDDPSKDSGMYGVYRKISGKSA